MAGEVRCWVGAGRRAESWLVGKAEAGALAEGDRAGSSAEVG